MPKPKKTSFQDQLSFRFDFLGGDLLVKITRELSKTRKLLPNITNDQQSMSWIWRGSGVEADPYYWVKVTATDIVTFAGFYVDAQNWDKFRRDVREALLESLSGIDSDFVSNFTTIYGWIIPAAETSKLKELIKFSHLAIPEDLEVVERFSSLLVNPVTKQRIFFEGVPESLEEVRFTLSVQTNRFEDSLRKVFEHHFASTDAAYTKANSFIESL